MAKTRKKRAAADYIDPGFLAGLILLSVFGLIVGYSANGYQGSGGRDIFMAFAKQGLIAGVSFAAALWVSKADYHHLWYLRWPMFVFSAALIGLLMVKPIAVTLNSATRWLRMPGGFTIQPSEFAKLGLIVFLPSVMVNRGRDYKGFLAPAIALVPGIFLAAETYLISSDLSSAFIIFAIGYFLAFAAHPKSAGFFIAAGAAVIVAAAAVYYVWTTMTPDAADSFRIIRLLIWKDPAAFEGQNGEQTIMGLYAIGNGGLFGKGFGNSTMKLGQLSEPGNDWIFAVICEELGFFGALLVILLFIFLLYRILVVAMNAPDLLGALMAAGVFIHIAVQALLHIAVTVNFAPPTGVTLPFFSYGGTSILTIMMEMAIVMSVSRQTSASNYKKTVRSK